MRAGVRYTSLVVIRVPRGSGWRLFASALILCAVPAWAGVADYEIEVELDPANHRLNATEKIRWTNPTDTPTAEIYFHLYLNAFASCRPPSCARWGVNR